MSVQSYKFDNIIFLSNKRLTNLDKVHGLRHSGLHQLLDVPFLLVRELVWAAARAARTSTVRSCKLVVMLPRAIGH